MGLERFSRAVYDFSVGASSLGGSAYCSLDVLLDNFSSNGHLNDAIMNTSYPLLPAICGTLYLMLTERRESNNDSYGEES